MQTRPRLGDPRVLSLLFQRIARLLLTGEGQGTAAGPVPGLPPLTETQLTARLRVVGPPPSDAALYLERLRSTGFDALECETLTRLSLTPDLWRDALADAERHWVAETQPAAPCADGQRVRVGVRTGTAYLLAKLSPLARLSFVSDAQSQRVDAPVPDAVPWEDVVVIADLPEGGSL